MMLYKTFYEFFSVFKCERSLFFKFSLKNQTANRNKMHNSNSRFIKILNSLFRLNMGHKLSRSSSSRSISNKLSEDAIQLLLSNTKLNREEIIDFHENFLKDCPNGYLTKKDFIRMFKELHPSETKKQKADKFCEYVFRAIESNDAIEFTDFVVCFSITSFGNLKEKITLAFKIYDLDKNQVIDEKEMLKVLEALFDLTGIPDNDRKGDQSPKAKVESMMKQLDKNGNNVLEFDEFYEGCMSDELVRKILIDPMFNC